MQVSIDIILYPLNEKFIPPIDDFISSLRKYDNIDLRTNSMSNQLFGKFDDLMSVLRVEIEKSFINSKLAKKLQLRTRTKATAR